MALCAGGHNPPRGLSLSFSALVRNTSERSKLSAQRKCATGMGEVGLLKRWLYFIKTNNSRELFRSSATPTGRWKFSAVVCSGHRLAEAKFPAGIQMLLVSDSVLCSVVLRQSPADMDGILIKSVVVTDPRGITSSLRAHFTTRTGKMKPIRDKSKCLHLGYCCEGGLP